MIQVSYSFLIVHQENWEVVQGKPDVEPELVCTLMAECMIRTRPYDLHMFLLHLNVID